MEFQYQVGDEIKSVRVEREGDAYQVSIDGRAYEVKRGFVRPGQIVLTINGQRHVATLADSDSARYVSIDGEVVALSKATAARSRRRSAVGGGSLGASMPGQITKVLVAEGDIVERGQTLVMLEAMKMEIKVAAPHAGRVKKVKVKQGQVVDRGQALVEIAEQ